MRDYKKYEVWQRAHSLTLFVYKDVVEVLPKRTQFDLASQIKRAAYSIPLNFVEGCGRSSDKEFCRFLDIALGSVHELEYACLLALDLDFITKERKAKLDIHLNEVKAKLINLIKSIRR